MDYAAILVDLFPDSVWTLNGDEYSGLVWDESNTLPKPSKETLDDAWPAVAYKREYEWVRLARHAAYAGPDGPDAIFLQYQRGTATEQEWLDAVQAVKDAHPYPETV
jgi:hypothetical protein